MNWKETVFLFDFILFTRYGRVLMKYKNTNRSLKNLSWFICCWSGGGGVIITDCNDHHQQQQLAESHSLKHDLVSHLFNSVSAI